MGLRLANRRDIGVTGENVFQSWCEPEGFRAQKSFVDRLGWDFLLESEPERSDSRPLDGQNDLPKFIVQVKSTEQVKQPPRIKLSALKHLVDTDMPAVIVVLLFLPGERAPHRSLLVPVDDQLMSDALHRVRREEAKGNRNIHRTTLPVPLDRAIELKPDGDGLGKALLGMVDGSPSAYIARKSRHRQTCGFDDGAVVGTCFVPGKDAREKISQLFLGGRRKIEVKDLTIERRRFGIALKSDVEHLQDVILEMDVPSLMPATIELEAETGEWVAVEVGLFAAPKIGEPSRAPIRLANEYLELIIDFGAKSADFSFEYALNRSVEFEEAVTIVEVGAILARPVKTLTISFRGSKLELPFDLGQGPFKHWIHAAPLLRRIAAALARSSQYPLRKLQLSNFYRWIDKHLEYLALASTPGVSLTFPRWPDDAIIESQDTILVPYSLDLPRGKYAALIEIPMQSVRCYEGAITITGGQPRVITDIVRGSGADTDDFIEAAIERSKRDRNTSEPALIAGGFANWNAVSLTLS